MKDWFKARNIWGAAISALSDEEAGRLAKAVWAYTMTGEVVEIEGAGKGILAMIIMTLGQDAEKDDKISEVRAIAGKKGGLNTSYGKHQQMQAIDSKCKQTQSNDGNCSNKNKNKNIEQEQESESESFIADADAHRIQTEHNQLLDAAKSAGFKCTDSEIAHLLRLYADYGLSKVLEGIKSCVQHSAPNLAYLGAVLKGSPKKAKTHVVAQEYEQRDYTEMVREQEEAQRNHILERLKARNVV